MLHITGELNVVARKKEKEKKKYNWSTKGGHIAPIFVPPTPNSELALALKEIADTESEAGVHFKIIETGGHSMRSVLQRSNPLETAGCENPKVVHAGGVELTIKLNAN